MGKGPGVDSEKFWAVRIDQDFKIEKRETQKKYDTKESEFGILRSNEANFIK